MGHLHLGYSIYNETATATARSSYITGLHGEYIVRVAVGIPSSICFGPHDLSRFILHDEQKRVGGAGPVPRLPLNYVDGCAEYHCC